MRIALTGAATNDLRRIHSFYAARNPHAAERIIARIDETFRLLSRHPLLGRERSRLAPGVRGILSGAHVVLYLVRDEAVTILRIIDGRMDIETEFKR